MLKIVHKKAQAAVELAVFGAILIFLLGAIIRSAAGNSYTQNQNFKAMRMAMLNSWNGSKVANTSRNSASILFIEDRLSPDFNKYGDLDRNPYIANGSGTFTYELLYPLASTEVGANLPIMDVYINGQYFPFTTASYVANKTIGRPGVTPGVPACANEGPYETPPSLTQQQCLQNQCLRNAREWVGGTVTESMFDNTVNPAVQATACPIPAPSPPTQFYNMECDASVIFNELVNEGMLINAQGSEPLRSANPSSLVTAPGWTLPTTFITWLETTFPNGVVGQAQINQVQNTLQNNKSSYKLFYEMAANGTAQYYPTTPPSCTTHPCKDKELSADLSLGGVSNANGDLMFDLQRNGLSNAQIEGLDGSPSPPAVPMGLRPYMAWQWGATAGTTATLIGLNVTNNQYSAYDVDGRLSTVTIYNISQNPDGTPVVSYEDYQGGDIDSTWDSNSCGPKPGLQPDSQIFTFTQSGTLQNGTYLQIKEGQLYNPETGQVVRSANKKDTIDLIQREIQLSNNTGRFCNGTTPQPCVATCTLQNGNCTPSQMSCPAGSTANPVEVCASGSAGDTCFSSQQNVKSTCYDESDNIIYVRSRLEDRRGNSWMTNAAGQLQVQ